VAPGQGRGEVKREREGGAGGVVPKQAGQEASGMGRIERAWVWLRESLARYRAAIGERDEAVALQREWLGRLEGKRVLEIGAGQGMC